MVVIILLVKHMLSFAQNVSCGASNQQLCVTYLRVLIVFLERLSEADPDRQIDGGMLKRVNPGHPLTLISWIINGL